jgi:hypothetical protein
MKSPVCMKSSASVIDNNAGTHMEIQVKVVTISSDAAGYYREPLSMFTDTLLTLKITQKSALDTTLK